MNFRNPFKKQVRISGRFTSLKSSCIGNINYNPESGTLQITFSNPELGKWEYFNVDPYTVAQLETGNSQGEFFNRYIRDRYEYHRVY